MEIHTTDLYDFLLCPRYWYLRKVLNAPMISKNFQTTGQSFHSLAEHYLKSGRLSDVNTPLGRLLSAGVDMLPEPDDCLWVEKKITFHFQGVRFKSAIDCFDPRTGVIYDFKTFAKDEYLPGLLKNQYDVQLAMYSVYVFLCYPDLQELVFKWLYFKKKTAKTPIEYAQVVSRERALSLMNVYAKISKFMISLAVEPTKRLTACSAYGGCKASDSCGRSIPEKMQAFLDTSSDDPYIKIQSLYLEQQQQFQGK